MIIKSVLDLCESFTKEPQYVHINYDVISSFATTIPNFKPNCVHVEKEVANTVISFELLASSINYCYWYGKSNVRPNGSGAVKMHKILSGMRDENYQFGYISKDTIKEFISRLSFERFPLIEQRAKHLYELLEPNVYHPTFLFEKIWDVQEGKSTLEECLETLIRMYPGFAQDMFLKRAVLFFMELERQVKFFGNQIYQLFIPADYQVPKMLKHYGILKYSDELEKIIQDSILIPENSLIECEIRASSIVACQKLSEESGKNQSDIDFWLWENRKSCNDNFHLTVTTNY